MSEAALVAREEDVVKHASAIYVHGNRVDGFAFLPRPLPKDGDGSSVNRLSVLSTDDDAAMAEVRRLFRLNVKASHRFAQIGVGDLIDCLCHAASIAVHVVADPLPTLGSHRADPSHALIRGLPRPGSLDNLVGDFIREKIKRVHPAIP